MLEKLMIFCSPWGQRCADVAAGLAFGYAVRQVCRAGVRVVFSRDSCRVGARLVHQHWALGIAAAGNGCQARISRAAEHALHHVDRNTVW